MTIKQKVAQVASTRTTSKPTFDDTDFTKPDPLLGWHSLAAKAKQSNDRTPKRGWKRNSRGRIDPLLAAHIALLALIALLVSGGPL